MRSGTCTHVNADPATKEVVFAYHDGVAVFSLRLSAQEALELGFLFIRQGTEAEKPGYWQRMKERAALLREAIREGKHDKA